MNNNLDEDDSFSRKTLRLKGYDYSQPGAYFVTICTKNKGNLFGRIVSGKIILNNLGIIARRELLHLHNTYSQVKVYDDEYVIMPDHVHTIIWIMDVGATEPVAQFTASGLQSHSLGSIIGQYKSRVTKKINQFKTRTISPIWQRNYFERIIRNQKELLLIKKYITDNPLKWEEWMGSGILKILKE